MCQTKPLHTCPKEGRDIHPRLERLILTHIFWGRLEKPIARDGLVKQSTVARNPDGRFADSMCKMWVRISLERTGLSVPIPVKAVRVA